VLVLAVALGVPLLASASAGTDPLPGTRIMPLGDSLTVGFSFPGAYRNALEDDLTAGGRQVDFVGSRRDGPASLADGDHEGHDGWRIDQIDTIVESRLATYAPDIVLLLVGTNDVVQDHDLPGAPERLGALVDRITSARPSVQVYVSSIPPLADPADRAQVDAFNAALPGVLAARAAPDRVHLVDGGSAVEVGALVDGVHPDAAGYASLGHAWHQALAAAVPPSGTDRPSGARVAGVLTPNGSGVWLTDSAGHVSTEGAAPYYGAADHLALRAPIVGMARTVSGEGYWLLGRDGGIFTNGDAGFDGSTGGMALQRPVVDLAADPDGGGYWLVAADGGVFAFGAPFLGSAGAIALRREIVGLAPTTTGRGYWLVAADGGVFSYGDARFAGSTGAVALRRPIVGIAADPDGAGYWLVAADGGVFAFDAPFAGSGLGRLGPGDDVVSINARPTGGYTLVTTGGTVLAFGPA
jgi:lysophospholipase L1-like esterase